MLSVAAAVVLAWAASAVGTPGLRASAATDPVIAAAGDIACDPANSQFNNGLGGAANCRQKYTSDLLVNMNPAAVLDLGDNQYYCGGYQAFLQSYDLSWGRLKSITHPSVGNHEYITSGGTGCDSTNGNAAGYFKYFGALAGTTGQGWYSYDIGAWHIIALNSNCGDIGGCGSGTAEYQWLQSDLAAHPAYCTLAYWHIPLFSSGGRAAPNSQPLWQLLYNSQADVILNGHDHVYERFAPQDPTGAADLPRGLREFIVGTGGADHTSFPLLAANSELRNANTFGVLKLTLHSTSYDWQFVPEAGYTFTDTGTNNCHDNVPDTTPPSAPSNFAATTVAYNQVGLTWTASKDNVAVTGYRVFRNNVQLASTSGRSYVDTTVQAQTGYSYYVTAFDAAGLSSAQSNTVAVTTPPAASALVFGPADDSYVQSDQPATNFGAGSQVVVDNSPVRHTYLKFNVSGLGTQSILSARLRLYCVDGSPFGGEFHRVADSTWSQGTLTWNNAPAADAAILGSLGTVAPGTWYEVDVTSLVTGNGTYSIEGQSSSTDGAYYSSNEGTAGFAPQLVVTLSASGTVTPTPTTTATPTNTPTATSTGTVTGSLLFSDGFETGSLSPQWSTVQGLVVQNQEVASGSFAARGTSAGAGAAYARTTLSSAQSDLYYRIRFKVLSLGANTVNLLKFRTAADGSILSLSITNTGMLSYRNDVTGIANNSTLAVSPGAWQTLQAHVRIAGTAGLVEVWYNDAPVSALTRTESLGTNPVGRLQLGENTTGLTYDIAFDDAGVSLAYIGSSPALTPTFTPTATATPSSIATSTNTPTATPTATSTPTAGPTATPTFTPTATPTASSGVAAFAPEADTYVLSSQPTINFATNTSLRADGSPDMHSYARFAVAGLNGAPITRVTLLFFITSGSSSTLQARAVSDTAWGEKAVTYNNAPVMGGTIATSGVLATGTWISLDVTGYVTAEGAYSFGIITPGSTAVAFGSRESTAAPRLIVETAQ